MLRRAFLARAVAAIGGLLTAVVGIPAIRYLADPLWRSRKRPAFIRVTPLSAVDTGRPVRVVVLADRRDAYTHHPPRPIGAVWLLRPQEGVPKVRCLQVICPHLGCAIDYAADRDVFVCPCHASEFDRLGRRVVGPAPRDMDELPCRVSAADESGQRWVEVQYDVFKTGIAEKSRMK